MFWVWFVFIVNYQESPVPTSKSFVVANVAVYNLVRVRSCHMSTENESDQHLTLGSGQARRLPDGRDQVELHQVRGEQGRTARGQVRPHRRSRAQGRGGVQETFLTVAIQIQKLVQIYKPIL